MHRISLIFFTLCVLAFVGFQLEDHGLPRNDEDRILVLLLLIQPILTLTYIFFGSSKESLFELWIESKKKKLRKEMDNLDKKD